MIARARAALLAPCDVGSLVALRGLFGLVMSAAALRFLAKGWVQELLVEPSFHFTYPGFAFVKPLPGPWMVALYLVLAVVALGVALGFYYRICAVTLFIGFTYVELIDRALYLNHYYLVSLLAGLLVLLPAGRSLSLDVLRKPELALGEVPAWTLFALRLQVGVVYLFAGVAKLNADWLLEAQPLRIWLAARAGWPWLTSVTVAYVASWLGAAFDLTIVGFLLWPRTRAPAFIALLSFHLVTGLLFPIGIFPWLMSAAATIFLAPDWPRPWLERAAALVRRDAAPPRVPRRIWSAPGWLLPLVALHCAAQLILPLRRFFDPGPSAWTQRGFDFGWNVMVAEKAGHASFRVRDRLSGQTEHVEAKSLLAPFQEVAMARDPQLVRQVALFLAERYLAEGRQVAVFADSFASLNGRPSTRMLDPHQDLTEPLRASWILPLK